jgi:hypothetical protein
MNVDLLAAHFGRREIPMARWRVGPCSETPALSAVDEYEDGAQTRQVRPRDPAVERAMERLRAFFDSAPQRLFYSTQIQTALEREFFHWITGRALLELGNARVIHRITVPLAAQMPVNFYANRRHRYVQRELKAMLELLARIFDPEFAHAVGRHGELMFDAAFGRLGFRAEAINTKSWQGRTWLQTNHNLDRIITRDHVVYGVEIKNTQTYIPHEESANETCTLRVPGLDPALRHALRAEVVHVRDPASRRLWSSLRGTDVSAAG